MSCHDYSCRDAGCAKCEAARTNRGVWASLPEPVRATFPEPVRPVRVAPPSIDPTYPCTFRGPPTGERATCVEGCGAGRNQLPVLACSKLGKCVIAKTVKEPGIACCRDCKVREAPRAAAPLIAPLAGWEGTRGARPWEGFGVTVALPHLDTLPELRLAVDLWRCQTVRPYFQVVDTGSSEAVIRELETLRSSDLEIHYIRAHAYRHPSAVVTAALDLSQSLCRTEYLFHTHTDVFPRRRDFLSWMIGQCSPASPVVGWRMSPRSRGEWAECVSHTATVLHMPTARRAGLWWTMERHFDQYPADRGRSGGWPDTESPFRLACVAAGVAPVLLGDEPNYERHDTEWFTHARSYTGLKHATRAGDVRAKAMAYTAAARHEAEERLAAWRAQ